jgi:Carbohydrate-selective porin, OprB family
MCNALFWGKPDPGLRLWELWYQQAFGDHLDVKIGQQSVDQQFMISQYGAAFVNAMFGFPALSIHAQAASRPYGRATLAGRTVHDIGDPYLVGTLRNAACVVDALRGDWHVVAPDWRGFGREHRV